MPALTPEQVRNYMTAGLEVVKRGRDFFVRIPNEWNTSTGQEIRVRDGNIGTYDGSERRGDRVYRVEDVQFPAPVPAQPINPRQAAGNRRLYEAGEDNEFSMVDLPEQAGTSTEPTARQTAADFLLQNLPVSVSETTKTPGYSIDEDLLKILPFIRPMVEGIKSLPGRIPTSIPAPTMPILPIMIMPRGIEERLEKGKQPDMAAAQKPQKKSKA